MISNIMKTSAILLAGVGASTAASISSRASPFGGISVSSNCQNALIGIASNSEASKCLNIPGLVGIVTVQPNASVVQPLNTWLQGVCGADACSNDTINAIASNITTACQSDLSQKGVSQSAISAVVQALPQFYPTVRKMACLKTSSNDTLCASSTLLDIEQNLGQPLSINNALSSLMEIFSDVKSSNLPRSVVCTGCIQGAFDILQQDVPSVTSNSNVQNGVSSTCGSDFLSGTATSDVTEGTGTAAPTSSLVASNKNASGAVMTVPSLGAAFSMLSAIAGAFILFA